jgi:hypothetical protein
MPRFCHSVEDLLKFLIYTMDFTKQSLFNGLLKLNELTCVKTLYGVYAVFKIKYFITLVSKYCINGFNKNYSFWVQFWRCYSVAVTAYTYWALNISQTPNI